MSRLRNSRLARFQDIRKHSKGIWLTYRIPYNEETKSTIIDFIINNTSLEYSYQFYGTEEEGHISIRIHSINYDGIRELNKFLDSKGIEYTVCSYDEEYHVKLAYILATKLVENLKYGLNGTYVNIERNHILEEVISLIIHGMFNNLKLSKLDEIQILLRHVYHLV